MSVTLSLHTPPSVPLEAAVLKPDTVAGLSAAAIAELPLHHGNEAVTVGDFFRVSGEGNGTLRLEGDLSRVKHVGAGMTRGEIIIEGHVGEHLGAGMSGGEISVAGNAGDWVGPEMTGGRIRISGDAGHMVGSAYRGSRVGVRGGEILVHGRIGNEAGNAMRRGLIAVGGDSGDFTGVNMLAGSIIVLGQLGLRSGAGMRRGSIVSMRDAELLPTFSYASTYQPVYLTHYLLYLKRLDMPVEDTFMTGCYRRWSGDSVELNRGEILLLAA